MSDFSLPMEFDTRTQGRFLLLGLLAGAFLIPVAFVLMRIYGQMDETIRPLLPYMGLIVGLLDFIAAIFIFHISWSGQYQFNRLGLQITPDRFGPFRSGAPRDLLQAEQLLGLRTKRLPTGLRVLLLNVKGKQLPITLGQFNYDEAEARASLLARELNIKLERV